MGDIEREFLCVTVLAVLGSSLVLKNISEHSLSLNIHGEEGEIKTLLNTANCQKLLTVL